MKKVLIMIVLLSLCTTSLFAQTKQKMAVVSFSGSSLGGDEAGALMDVFTSQLTSSEYRNDFTLLARNERALRTAFGELNFQRNASLDQNQMGELGKQLGAGWVFYGTVSSFGGANVTINILDVETSQIIATVNRRFSSVYDVANGSAASDMTKELINKARSQTGNISRSRARANTIASSSSNVDLQQQINSTKMVRNIGRGLWISGIVIIAGGVFCNIFAIGQTEYYVEGESGTSGYFDEWGNYYEGSGGTSGYYEYGGNPLATTLYVVGGLALASGIPVDIIYSTRLKNLQTQLNYSFVPIISPERDVFGQFTGNVDLGAQLMFSYKF